MSTSFLQAATARAADGAPKASLIAASALKAMFEKLSPMSMMEDNGLHKAVLALRLLETEAAKPGSASEFVEAAGVKALVQTMVLHPVPDLRQLAVSALSACIRQDDATFLKHAVGCGLPEALLRLLHESDRRVKAPDAVEDSAASVIDPDLPVRLFAMSGVEAALTISCSDLRDAIFSFPHFVSTVMGLLDNTSEELRRRGALLLLAFVGTADGISRDPAALPITARPSLVSSHVEEDVEESAKFLLIGALDPEETVQRSVLDVLLALRGCSALRGALQAFGAADELESAHDATVASGTAAKVQAVVTWLRSDGPPA